MSAKKFLMFACVVALLVPGTLSFAGVRQMRSVSSLRGDNTNVGTNAYADMNHDAYATINPSYSNQATAYHAQSGNVAVEPGYAQATGDYAVYDGYGAVVAGDAYYDYNGWAAGAPAGAMIPMGTILEYAPSKAVPVMVQGTRYYYAENVFLAEVFDGTAVVYQVVPAPLGAVVSMLPAGCIVQNFNGKSLTVCGNIYYQQVAGGYQVVALN
jgi:hypothetical protein